MAALRDAINYLLNIEKVEIPKFGYIREGDNEFKPEVYLEYDGTLGVVMNDVQVRFKARCSDGVLALANPPNGWSFTMRDISTSNKRR